MLTRRGGNLLRTNYRLFSQQINNDPLQSFRTKENNPINHSTTNCGQFYSVNREIVQTLFKHGGLPGVFHQQMKTFTETCIMIRNPAVEIIDTLKMYDSSKPAFKFVVYGCIGSGKSLTLAHLIHYAHETGYLIVHVPWAPEWVRRNILHREKTASTTHEGLVDLPMEAAKWLIHFKTQNQKILKTENLLINNEYVWSKRETSPAGLHVVELIDFGINRVKFATDVVFALIEEIKNFSNKKMCKTFVAIDGFNSFYSPLSGQKFNKRKVTPLELSLTQAFLELTRNDWCNGAIVVVTDEIAINPYFGSHFPRQLLGKNGFEHLDPFIPIEVPNYTDKEYLSCMNYYRDRLWVRGHPDAEEEFAFTTGKNPYNLMRYCASI